MKTIAYLIIPCVIAIVVVGNLYPWIIGQRARGVVEFRVPPGATSRHVGEILSEKGLIANEDVFVAGAVLLGVDTRMVAGKYVVPPRTGLLSLYKLLRRGQHHLNLVTVPEGLTLAETAEILAGSLGMDATEFLRWGNDSDFVNSLGIQGGSAEGYIFPDTYDIPQGTDARDIISVMVRRAMDVYSSVCSALESSPKLSMQDVFILASIVEAEVKVDEERPRVAAVFLNRMKEGMPLQADPTVAYALGGRGKALTYRDLEVDSPYNTYKHPGLPPGPICSPGEKSLLAVMDPLKPCREMYFVARGDGRHVFSETMDEHIRAKQQIRSERASGL